MVICTIFLSLAHLHAITYGSMYIVSFFFEFLVTSLVFLESTGTALKTIVTTSRALNKYALK